MVLVTGADLTTAQRREVLGAFSNRNCTDFYGHDDDRWLKDHAFYIRKDGRLSRVHKHCEPHWMAGRVP